MDSTAAVEHEVRQRVRGLGFDPQREPGAIDELITDALADYDERAVRESLPPLADREETRRAVRDAVAGLGPLQQYLDDDEVEEIWINAPSRVFVARRGIPELTATVLTEEQVRALVEHMLMASGRRLDLSSPFVDASLAGGERLHVVIPDITRRHWAINIRKFIARSRNLRDLVALGTVSQTAAGFLAGAVRAGLSIVVAGSTQSGKTTTLAALAGEIAPSERIVTCEEVFELRLAGRDTVAMQCRQANLEGEGEIPLRRLVAEALRMRPDRLIIGEVRGAEALDMLIALNCGIPGLCTIHANSAREAITKLATLPLLAAENVSDRFVVPTIAAVVDLVVHLVLGRDGTRRVQQILAVPGEVEGAIIAADPLFSRGTDGTLRVVGGHVPRPERFEAAGIDPRALLAGG